MNGETAETWIMAEPFSSGVGLLFKDCAAQPKVIIWFLNGTA